MKHDPVVIVGMHRSGTSFLAGSLQECGLRLGPVSERNPFNRKGSRENPKVTRFHETILSDRGGSWDAPPTQPIRWSPLEADTALALFEGYERTEPWGFKDPRAILMIDSWMALFQSARTVGIFRHPKNVARSLGVRNGFDEEKSISLWLRYNSELLKFHARSGCPLVCFDLASHALHARLDEIATSLALKPPSGSRFFSADLKHHVDSDDNIPRDAHELYAALMAAAQS